METNRFFIEITYNGTPYHGWQTQPNGITVQACLDEALTTCFRQPIETLGCGRTDAGVHATQFFAHFDVSELAVSQVIISIESVNALLPYSIAAKRILKVANSAHARFDATARKYHYELHFRKDPFKIDRSWLYKQHLDLEAMNKAASTLLAYTDFSCFSKSNTQTFTNNCKITEARFEQLENGLRFVIKADRFLRNMVRAIMGTLIRIGKGEIDVNDFNQIIESKNRSKAGQSVPACGLYLVEVEYPFLGNDGIKIIEGLN